MRPVSDVRFRISVPSITLLDIPSKSSSSSSANSNNSKHQQHSHHHDIQQNPSSYAFQLRWFVSDVLNGASPFLYDLETVQDGKEAHFDFNADFELENASYHAQEGAAKGAGGEKKITINHVLHIALVACPKKYAKSIEAGLILSDAEKTQQEQLGKIAVQLDAHTPKKTAGDVGGGGGDNNNKEQRQQQKDNNSTNNSHYYWKTSSQRTSLYMFESPLTPPPLFRIAIRGEAVYPPPSPQESDDDEERHDENGKSSQKKNTISTRSNSDNNSNIDNNKENRGGKARHVDDSSIASPIPVKPRTYGYVSPPSSRSGSKQQQQQQQQPKSSTTTTKNKNVDEDLVALLDEIQNTSSSPSSKTTTNNKKKQEVVDDDDEDDDNPKMSVEDIINFDFTAQVNSTKQQQNSSSTATKNLLIAFETAKKQLKALTSQNETQRRENIALQRRNRLQQEEIKKLKEQVSEVGVGRVRAIYEVKLMEMKDEINSLTQANLDLRSMSQSAEILADSLALELEQAKYEAREGAALARDSQEKLAEYMQKNENYERAIRHGQEEIVKLHSYCAQAKSAFEDALQALQKEKTENALNKRRVEDLQKLLDASRLIQAKERETSLPLR